MDIPKLLDTREDLSLVKAGMRIPAKKCNCCGAIWRELPADGVSDNRRIYFDCVCGSTLAIKQKPGG